MTANLDTVIPFNIDDCEYVDISKEGLSTRVDSVLEEESKTIKPILGTVETKEHLMALREITTSHKESQSQISRLPKIGEIILVKDDNVLGRTWKLALIKEYILSKDGQIRSVIIQLLNKQLVSRAINHLFPLEIQATQSEDIKNEA